MLDAAIIKAITKPLGRAQSGRLQVTLPSGCSTVVGVERRGLPAHIAVNRYKTFWKCWRRGPLGFAEPIWQATLIATI
jgi:hypothetical protein